MINLLARDAKPYVRNAFILESQPSLQTVKTRTNHFFYIIEGSGEICIDNNTYEIAKGCAILVVPGSEYRWAHAKSKHWKIVTLTFNYLMDPDIHLHELTPRPKNENEAGNAEEIHFKDCDILNKNIFLRNMFILEQGLLEIITEYENKKIYFVTRTSGIFMSLLVMLVRFTLENENKYMKIINNIISYIQNNYSEEVNNEKLAQALNYHPNYLNNLMKSYSGITIHQYLISYRTDLALRLLLFSALTIKEIAAQIGFKNTTHFSASFRKRTGMSPIEYRAKRT